MDRAGAADDDEAIVFSVEDLTTASTSSQDDRASFGGELDFLLETGGRQEGPDVANPCVLSALEASHVRVHFQAVLVSPTDSVTQDQSLGQSVRLCTSKK